MSDASLERIYPNETASQDQQSQDTIRIHLERYRYAIRHLIPGVIADIACGAGYGSFFLATESKDSKILAVDNNKPAIAYANKHYAHPKISFVLEDAYKFNAGEQLNTVISLETIEHLPDPGRFVVQMAAQLYPGGRFIASAPITPSMDANPFHLQDFTLRRFKHLFTSCGLVEIDSFIQRQRYNPWQLFKRKKQGDREIRKGILKYYFKHPGKFWLRIGSVFKDGFTNKYAVVVFEKK